MTISSPSTLTSSTSTPAGTAGSSANGDGALLVSPNSVLANALLRSIDVLRPRIHASRPDRIEFVVGTQINGAPHLGTNLVQTAAFLLAKIARREFSIDTRVRCGAGRWTTPRTRSCSTPKPTPPTSRPTTTHSASPGSRR